MCVHHPPEVIVEVQAQLFPVDHKSGRGCGRGLLSIHRPTEAGVAGGDRRQMALETTYQKSDTTLQQSVLCKLSFLYQSQSTHTSINRSKWGLNIIQLISSVHGDFFLLRASLVITTCMLGKVVYVTPSLPRGKNCTGQAPLITDPPPTRMEAQNSCVTSPLQKYANLPSPNFMQL